MYDSLLSYKKEKSSRPLSLKVNEDGQSSEALQKAANYIKSLGESRKTESNRDKKERVRLRSQLHKLLTGAGDNDYDKDKTDPYLLYGPGLHNFLKIIRRLIVTFMVLSIVGILQIIPFRAFSGVQNQNGYGWLSNLSFASIGFPSE